MHEAFSSFEHGKSQGGMFIRADRIGLLRAYGHLSADVEIMRCSPSMRVNKHPVELDVVIGTKLRGKEYW